MSRHYWVNPTNTSSITGPYVIGDVVLDDVGAVVTQNLRGPAPAANIYLATEDNTPLPSQYHVREPDTLVFQGIVGRDEARVVETRNYSQMPIADLYQVKSQEIAAQDQRVRYNAADTSLAVNWWIVVLERFRFELNGIQGNWTQRQIDGQGWPGGANAPRIAIFNANTEEIRRQQVTDAATWNTLYEEVTMHDQATGNATNASGNALDAAYADGAGDWQAVADHDAADPAWGYPPIVQLPPEALAQLGVPV